MNGDCSIVNGMKMYFAFFAVKFFFYCKDARKRKGKNSHLSENRLLFPDNRLFSNMVTVFIKKLQNK